MDTRSPFKSNLLLFMTTGKSIAFTVVNRVFKACLFLAIKDYWTTFNPNSDLSMLSVGTQLCNSASGTKPISFCQVGSPKLAALFQALTLLQRPLPEVEAHHRVAVLIDAVAEVLAGFQEKSLNPIYVHTRMLIPPRTPCFETSRDWLVA